MVIGLQIFFFQAAPAPVVNGKAKAKKEESSSDEESRYVKFTE